jgi:hypothetical protein
LPTIEELEKLYDPKVNGRYKIRKPFELTGWLVWSSRKKGPDCAWAFDFVNGLHLDGYLGDSPDRGALCVRGPGE